MSLEVGEPNIAVPAEETPEQPGKSGQDPAIVERDEIDDDEEDWDEEEDDEVELIDDDDDDDDDDDLSAA